MKTLKQAAHSRGYELKLSGAATIPEKELDRAARQDAWKKKLDQEDVERQLELCECSLECQASGEMTLARAIKLRKYLYFEITREERMKWLYKHTVERMKDSSHRFFIDVGHALMGPETGLRVFCCQRTFQAMTGFSSGTINGVLKSVLLHGALDAVRIGKDADMSLLEATRAVVMAEARKIGELDPKENLIIMPFNEKFLFYRFLMALHMRSINGGHGGLFGVGKDGKPAMPSESTFRRALADTNISWRATKKFGRCRTCAILTTVVNDTHATADEKDSAYEAFIYHCQWVRKEVCPLF